MIDLMDPDHRAPTLVPAYICAALIVAMCAIYWSTGLFDQLGSLHQFAMGN